MSMNISTGQKPCERSACGKVLMCHSSFHSHAISQSGYKLYEYKENVNKQCKCSSLPSLQRNMRNHTVNGPCQCEICLKSFGFSSSFGIHRQTHNGEKFCEYEQCGMASGCPSSLCTHGVTDTVEKYYECNQCGKILSSSSSLWTHERIHSGKTPYECKQCDSAFRCHRSFLCHKMIHSGESPFECKRCGNSSIYPSLLQIH